jgi:hypothetical protein
LGSHSDVYLIKTDSRGNTGVTEEKTKPQEVQRTLAATVVRNLAQGVVAYDAMGRRIHHPKLGIYFVRTAATAAPRKVLLVR